MSQHPCFNKYRVKLLTQLMCSYGDGGFDIMRELGVELEDYSLKMKPEFYTYYEGAVDQKDRVIKELYELLAKEDENLTSFVFNSSYSFRLEGKKDGGPDALKEVCDHLREKEKEADELTCTPPTVTGIPPTIRMCASCHDTSTTEWREKVPERIAPKAQKFMPPVRRLSARERKEIEDYLNASLREASASKQP